MWFRWTIITFLFAFYYFAKLAKNAHTFLEVADRSFISSWYEGPHHNTNCLIGITLVAIFHEFNQEFIQNYWNPYQVLIEFPSRFLNFSFILEIHWNSPKFPRVNNFRAIKTWKSRCWWISYFHSQNIRNCSENSLRIYSIGGTPTFLNFSQIKHWQWCHISQPFVAIWERILDDQL